MDRIGTAEAKYVEEVLAGEFRASRMSQMTSRLEAAFAQRFDMPFAIALNSGTAALHAAVAAAGIGPGDEVIVPALTMAATALAAVYEGAVPMFADVDPDTLTIDPASVASLVNERTRAIIPVSVYGLAPDFDPLLDLARRNGLSVIEDNAECYLGTYKGRTVGTIGDLNCFSLQGSKHITAGEGGVVLTRREDLADRVRSFSVLGYDAVRARRGQINKDILQSPDYVRHTGLGFKYRMPDLCAAVALGQLERLEALVEARRSCARALDEVVRRCSWLTPQGVPDGSTHSHYTYAVRLRLDLVDFTWHDFRSRFISFGGESLYAAWLLTFEERMWDSADHRLRAVADDPRWQGRFSDYWRERCPNATKVQPQILQFKTNLLSPDEWDRQAEILHRTVQSFA